MGGWGGEGGGARVNKKRVSVLYFFSPEFRSCVKVEVAVLTSQSLTVLWVLGLTGRKAIVFLSIGRIDDVTRCMPGGRYRSRLIQVSVVVPLVCATWKDRRDFRLCLRLPSVGDSKRTCLLHTLLDF